MKNEITIAAIQLNIEWEQPLTNFNKVKEWVKNISTQTDLIVFPEMFLTGFSMNVKKNAISGNHEFIEQLLNLSNKNSVAIAGSLMIEENGNYYNRFYFIKPDFSYEIYNKRHLFRMAGEHHHYKAGERRVIIEYKNIKINLAICYDLRFPVWLRSANDYDILLVVANWPEARIDAWEKLLMARAIENQTYVIGVNRCGIDGNNVQYNGSTMMVDYKGNIINKASDYSEDAVISTLNVDELHHFRKQFPVYLDADKFTIHD